MPAARGSHLKPNSSCCFYMYDGRCIKDVFKPTGLLIIKSLEVPVKNVYISFVFDRLQLIPVGASYFQNAATENWKYYASRFWYNVMMQLVFLSIYQLLNSTWFWIDFLTYA